MAICRCTHDREEHGPLENHPMITACYAERRPGEVGDGYGPGDVCLCMEYQYDPEAEAERDWERTSLTEIDGTRFAE